MERKAEQQQDVLDLLIGTLVDSQKKMDKLLNELEILIGILTGSIERREHLREISKY